MTQIKAFKGFTYNKDIIKDLSKVVCPPYDVISESQRQDYAQKDSRNLIHVLLSNESQGIDKYKAASKKFNDLIASNVLIQDSRPSIYFYYHQYTVDNKTCNRLGFIALLKIDDDKHIYPHENTHLAPKIDRLQLLNHVQANLSPIFVMFSDKQRLLKEIFEEKLNKISPTVDVIEAKGLRHKIWKIGDTKTIDLLKEGLADKPIFIADGHHRYEVARQFREKMKNLSENFSGQESFNFIMSYFTDIQSSDLTILPIHRLVKPHLKNQEKLKEKLAPYFNITELSDTKSLSGLLEKKVKSHVFGLYDGKTYFLELKDQALVERNIDIDKPKVYKNLDVNILKYLILRPLFGDSEAEVGYTINMEEAKNAVDNKMSSLAIFVNPVKIEELLAVASEQEKMPQKSTYFYPKVLSGLVIHKFDEFNLLSQAR